MRYAGVVTDLEEDLEDGDAEVREAVVTDTRISLDWDEEHQSFHMQLTSTDGVTFQGHYGSPRPIPSGQ